MHPIYEPTVKYCLLLTLCLRALRELCGEFLLRNESRDFGLKSENRYRYVAFILEKSVFFNIDKCYYRYFN
jgi:hypothetical protein